MHPEYFDRNEAVNDGQRDFDRVSPPIAIAGLEHGHHDGTCRDHLQADRDEPHSYSITLMSHGIDETAAIIGAVVERCARDDIALTEIFIDPELAELLGLVDGGQLPHGSRPRVRCEAGLGRQVSFSKGLNELTTCKSLIETAISRQTGRRFSMSEFEKALKAQGKNISPVLLELGWRRKRIWSTTGQYHRPDMRPASKAR